RLLRGMVIVAVVLVTGVCAMPMGHRHFVRAAEREPPDAAKTDGERQQEDKNLANGPRHELTISDATIRSQIKSRAASVDFLALLPFCRRAQHAAEVVQTTSAAPEISSSTSTALRNMASSRRP